MTNDNRQSTAVTYGVSVDDVVIIDGSPTIDGMEPAEWYEAVHGDDNIEDDVIRVSAQGHAYCTCPGRCEHSTGNKATNDV